MFKTPLRTELLPAQQQAATQIGWFPEVEAHASLWFKGRALKDLGSYTGADFAIKAVKGFCDDHEINGDCGLEAAVTIKDVERAMVWRGDVMGWEYPPKSPPPIIRGQRLAWTSRLGSLSENDFGRAVVRFCKRFAISGARADECNLTQLVDVEIDPFCNAALFAGLGHNGFVVCGREFRVADMNNTDRKFVAEVSGSITILCRPIVDALDLCRKHLFVGCYPIPRDAVWFHELDVEDTTRWEMCA